MPPQQFVKNVITYENFMNHLAISTKISVFDSQDLANNDLYTFIVLIYFTSKGISDKYVGCS